MLFDMGIDKGADLSDDRVYRYRLWRRWRDGDQMTFIGVNPSTADETEDDQTIKKCIGFTKRHDCTAVQMLNLFAFRHKNPEVMKKHRSPIGPRNDEVLLKYAREAKFAVACWGIHGEHMGRARQVIDMLSSNEVTLMCFGLTKFGFPKHPVMLPYKTHLQALP